MGLHRIAPPFGGSASVLTPGLCHNCSSAASELHPTPQARPSAAGGTRSRWILFFPGLDSGTVVKYSLGMPGDGAVTAYST